MLLKSINSFGRYHRHTQIFFPPSLSKRIVIKIPTNLSKFQVRNKILFYSKHVQVKQRAQTL